MDRLSKLLGLVLILVPCSAQMVAPGPIMRTMTAGSQTYLLRETWNGSTEDNTWTDTAGSGTWDDDYATTPAEGAACLRVNNEGPRYATFTGTDDAIYMTAYWRSTDGNSIYMPGFYDSSGTRIGEVRMVWSTDHWNPRLNYNGGSANAVDNTVSLSANTWYLFKVTYNNGTGSNGSWQVHYSTVPFSSWTATTINVTTASDTAQAARIYLPSLIHYEDTDFDDIRVNTVAGGGDTY